jgi:hypothetical protein
MRYPPGESLDWETGLYRHPGATPKEPPVHVTQVQRVVWVFRGSFTLLARPDTARWELPPVRGRPPIHVEYRFKLSRCHITKEAGHRRAALLFPCIFKLRGTQDNLAQGVIETGGAWMVEIATIRLEHCVLTIVGRPETGSAFEVTDPHFPLEMSVLNAHIRSGPMAW